MKSDHIVVPAALPIKHCRWLGLVTVLVFGVVVFGSSATARTYLGAPRSVAQIRSAGGGDERNETHCTDVAIRAPYAELMRVQHCRRSARTGVFVIADIRPRGPAVEPGREGRIPYSLLAECTGQPVYRVRILGREILYARTERRGSNETHAEYELGNGWHNGTYHAEILQLYANFSHCGNLPPLNDEPVVALHQWHVGGGDGGGTVDAAAAARSPGWRSARAEGGEELLPTLSPSCGASSIHFEKNENGDGRSSGAPCPPCALLSDATDRINALAQGRWIADTSSAFVNELLVELQRTYIRGDKAMGGIVQARSNVTRASVVPSSMLRWQPSQCSLEPTARTIQRWRHKCSASAGLVCFAGDSQMRHMATQADAILNARTIPYLNSTLRTVPAFDWGRYIPLKLGERGEAERVDWSNCTQLAVNVGQWPLSKYAGGDGRPWSIQQYYQVATELVGTVLRKAPRLGKIYWVSTQPRGLHRSIDGSAKSPPTDWRTDMYIIQQNEVMRAHCHGMRAPLMEYLDTHAVLDPLSDLSYDGGHYLGTPGHWAAALVLHTLCT